MRYSTEPKNRTCVKGYGFFSSAKNMSKNLKNLSNKYGQKLLATANKSTTQKKKIYNSENSRSNG